MTAKKFGPQEALKAGLVDKIVPHKDLLSEARKLAEELAPKGDGRDVYGQMKGEMYFREYETCVDIGLRGASIVTIQINAYLLIDI